MKTILFQGDSVTDTGRTRGDHKNANMETGFGYPTLIYGELGYEYPGQYRFLNRGIGGERSIDLYARIKPDILQLKPDYLSILIGVNDVWHELDYKNGLSPEKYSKIYSMMIEEIKEALPDTQIMILEPFVGQELNWPAFHTGVHAMAQKAREVAEKYHLVFVPLQDKFNEARQFAPDSYWLMDEVHPTPAGHEIIKREWIKAFKKMHYKSCLDMV